MAGIVVPDTDQVPRWPVWPHRIKGIRDLGIRVGENRCRFARQAAKEVLPAGFVVVRGGSQMDDAQPARRSASAGNQNRKMRLPTSDRMAGLFWVIGWVSGVDFKGLCVDHHRCSWPGPRQQLADQRRPESLEPIVRKPPVAAQTRRLLAPSTRGRA